MDNFLYPDWFPMQFVIGTICVLFVVAPFLASPLVAIAKGYSPYYWLFACGPIGLIVIVCQPPLRSISSPDEYESWQQRTNRIGAILSGIQLFVGLMLSSLVLVVFA